MLFNLLAEFQRASAMTGYRQLASLRVQVFLCGAVLKSATLYSTNSHAMKSQLRARWTFKPKPQADRSVPWSDFTAENALQLTNSG